MGCPTSYTREMIRCLRYRPARALVQAHEKFLVSIRYHRLILPPIVLFRNFVLKINNSTKGILL